jgi:hypothetical protein
MAIDRPDWSGGLPVPSGAGVVPATDADYAGLGPQAQSTLQTGTGLHHELAREMQGTPDGFDANLESLKASAEMVLDEVGDREAFISAFDELSPSVQTKALRAAWQNPGRSFLDLLDIVEPTLTLAEQAEAEAWVRKLRGLL